MPKSKTSSDSLGSPPSGELIESPVLAETPGSSWPQSGFPADDMNGAGIDFSRYLHALRRRWLMAVIVALPLGAVAAYAVWSLQPRLYTANAILRLATAETTLIFETADKASAGSFDIYKRTQRQLLRSRFVVTRALRDEALAKLPVVQEENDPAEWLENNLTIAFPDESEIMHVSLSAGKPEGLHLLVNGVVQAYFDEIVFAERNRKLERRNSLELAHRKAETELRAKRTELKQLVERVGTGDSTALTLVQQNTLQQFAAFQQRYAQVRFELMQAQTELDLHEAAAAGDKDGEISDDEVLLAMRIDPALVQLRTEKQRIQEHITATKGAVKKDSSATHLAGQDRRLDVCDEKIEARKVALKKELNDFRKHSAVAGADDLRRKIVLLTAQDKQLKKKSLDLEDEARQLGRSSIDVEMMRAEITALQDVFSRLGAELERTNVELQPDSKSSWTRVSLMSEAQPARTADSKARLTKSAGGGALSLLLSLFFVVWLDVRKNRINSGTEVMQGLGLSVIGSVPMIPSRVMRRLHGRSANQQYWRTLLSESVDSIAAVLLCGAKAGANRVVMVSSATAGEGKTTLAANLATSLASAGCRTALIDFDLRRPALHRVFDLNLQPGIDRVLRKPDEYESAIQMTPVSNLAFLAAGRWSSSGLAGLAAADLKSLFDRLRAEFDFVVVDGSPILPVVDTRLIARHVDTVILSVLRDVSRVPQVKSACHLLEQFGVPVLGVVVTGSSGDVYKDSRYDAIADAKAV